ncbi:MAG: circadian clock protein KaiC [Verrucomicrobia bacterium]|nr:circadian clock protein KaiC [Verrucomicrobiota bacterium]
MPKAASPVPLLKKVPTGITGFDEITGGGVPAGRPTLICGSAGSGKSLFAMQFLIGGIAQHNEGGVLMTFEETADDIRKNVSSLGFDVDAFIRKKKLVIDFVKVDRSEIEESGEYDLEGLFIRLAHSIKAVGAKRVVLDTMEALFLGLSNQAILRSELRRLFGWLKEQGMTTLITGERGEGQLTRQGLEEYVSDCVILLDHRVTEQVSTRRLRVVKYRGSTHGTNEYPFLIDENGISILPITSSSLDYQVTTERITTGVKGLDEMLGGRGYYRGSTVLLTGPAGTGKTSVAAHLANATCARGERCVFFSFEESAAQILRNMRTIGLDLEGYVKRGLLEFQTVRPTMYGLEMHLVRMHKLIQQGKPEVVVIDPITNMQTSGTLADSTNMLIRLVDFLRMSGILGFLIGLSKGGQPSESTDEGLSSMVDAWLLLRDVESNGERNRLLYVLKARGMPHSNQVREFLITASGINLIDPYLGPGGVLTGSARVAQKAREEADLRTAEEEMERKALAFEHRRKSVEFQIEALRASFEADKAEFERLVASEKSRLQLRQQNQQTMARSRGLKIGSEKVRRNGGNTE